MDNGTDSKIELVLIDLISISSNFTTCSESFWENKKFERITKINSFFIFIFKAKKPSVNKLRTLSNHKPIHFSVELYH